MTRLKRWESPRKSGRNEKGRGGSARQRQLRKRDQVLRKRLKDKNGKDLDSREVTDLSFLLAQNLLSPNLPAHKLQNLGGTAKFCSSTKLSVGHSQSGIATAGVNHYSGPRQRSHQPEFQPTLVELSDQ